MHTYFYTGPIDTDIFLDKDESNHAVKVMRSRLNDKVAIINGKGVKAIGVITDLNAKKCKVTIDSKEQEAYTIAPITLAIAPTKSNDRMSVVLEKATEIGVDVIIPLVCKQNERSKINLERWNRVVLAATKQSGRFWLPKINEPITVKEYTANCDTHNKVIAYCEDRPEANLLDVVDKSKSTAILIGPEGDFTEEEVKIAEANGFTRVNLGANRLRTETAGLVAVTLLKI
jgi:16S rRNA (uracil1498-N3)-methyltransferase